jgi:predicted DNA-binding transcriptional regulator YafY
MSFKFDSMIEILNKLDRGDNVSVYSLTNDLEISERSVLRYMQTLKTYFPIYYDKQKGCYRFNDGCGLRKLKFSVEESLAFALAKDALRNFGTGMEESLESLEEKLSLKHSDVPGHIVLKPRKPSSSVKGYLGTIYEAITNFQSIDIVYKALSSKEETRRTVDPYYVFFPNGFWTLRAYCHLRGGMRTFALDRIVSLNVLDDHFHPKNISPEEEIASSFGVWLDGEKVDVVLRFDKTYMPHIQRKKWHQSQKEKKLKDGRLEVSFKVIGLEDIKHWIYRWIPHVEVVSPKELKDTFKKELKQALAKA